MTLGRLLDNSGVRAAHQKAWPRIRSLGFSAPPPPSRKGEGLETGWMSVTPTWGSLPSSPNSRAVGELPCCGHIHMLGGGTPASRGQSCWPRPGDSSSPGHSYTSFIASCNRPVNIKLAFPWILWAVLANNWVQGAGGHGNFWSAVKWDRVVGHLGTSEWLPPEAGCLVDLSPYPGGHRALQKSVKTELNGGMPRWHHMSGVGGWGDECVHRAKETQEGEKNWGFFFLQG